MVRSWESGRSPAGQSSTRLRRRRLSPGRGLALALAFLFAACGGTDSAPEPAPTWPPFAPAESVRSASGMVVSGHPLASSVGAEVLENGGNAVDAAVAVGFALAAVLPRAGNIGGGGFLLYRSAQGEVRALDFRERAPLAAERDMFLDAEGEPTDSSVLGGLAAGVPGSVAGLWEMHSKLGSLPWSELVAPAVELARGHVIDEVRSADIAGAAEDLARFPASAEQFLPAGSPPPAGSRFRQPDLARTLEQVAAAGADGFYRGPVAELLVAEMDRSGGIIGRRDLEEYRALWRDPVRTGYRGRTLYSMPPPSSGGVTLAQILNQVEAVSPLPPFGSAELVGIETEAMRWAFIDRNRHLGDPDFVTMPLEQLLSKEYAAMLRSRFELGRATPTPPFEAQLREGGETTHYSVVDAAGNAAAITTTLNFSFGSKVTVTGAGFLLNNEMDDFATAPGRPNQFGLVQGETNAVAPGKRMLSSMTPTVVLDAEGELELVLGSPGGPTIITTVYHVLSNVLDHGMSLAAAVEAPRVHHQALPDRVQFEPAGLEAEVVAKLRAWGYAVEERTSTSGNVSAIRRQNGEWVGVADPRRSGGAAAPQPQPVSVVGCS